MLSSFVVFIVLSALYFSVQQVGKWRQRARAAEKQNTANRKAHEIQNDIALDARFRERVRRYFAPRS